ncbi:MAG TPA: YetF domain-containing protein [Mucilaginibacter sp.]|nr:YetF domain-containing protein [Mucilaginibacter sp.]
METLITLFGQGKDLNALQMSCRGIVVFIIALALIRISGRRSFGVRSPLDNIISISLGAVLSRAIVGASDFLPVIVTCFVIVLIHRLVGWLIAVSKPFGRFIEGEKILLFQDGVFLKEHMKKALVCQEDLMQGVRKSALTENMDLIQKVYMERNGEISAIRK